MSLDAETNDDGTKYRARLWRDGGPLIVECTGIPRYVAPPDAKPATHWNRAMLDGPFINTQNGKLLRPKITSLGVRGNLPNCPHQASGFALRGDADLDTWYTDAPRWVGLAFQAGDGSVIRYEAM